MRSSVVSPTRIWIGASLEPAITAMISSGNSTGSEGSAKLRSITSSVELRQRRSTSVFGGPTTLNGTSSAGAVRENTGITAWTRASRSSARSARRSTAARASAVALSPAPEGLAACLVPVRTSKPSIGFPARSAAKARAASGSEKEALVQTTLQLLQRQSEAVPKATDQHRHLRSLRPSVEMGLVQDKDEALVRVGCVVTPLYCERYRAQWGAAACIRASSSSSPGDRALRPAPRDEGTVRDPPGARWCVPTCLRCFHLPVPYQ